jgi:tetratricopeptide (TPR) repeat protein
LGALIQRDFFYDPGITFTRKEYLLTQFGVLVTYLRLFFFPAGQNLDWDYPVSVNLFNVSTISSLILLLMLACVGLLAHKRFRLLSLGIAAYFVTLAPTSSFIPIKDVIYEHRMYLAVAFLAMGCVHVLLESFARFSNLSNRRCLIGISLTTVIILPLLAGLTHARNEVWVSELSLWKDCVRKSPQKARVHNNYGRALYTLGVPMIDAAKKEFEIANRLSPGWPVPYHNLAIVYKKEGDYQRAIDLDHKAIELNPDYKDALYEIGKSHRELNQWEEARTYLERLISLAPSSKFLQAYLDLLDVYLQLGLRERALNLAEIMARMEGPLPRLEYYRGMAFYKLEDFERAKLYFARQTTHKSDRFNSYLMMGQLHYLEEDYKGAEEAFRQVLDGQPWSAAAHYNLAVLLEKSDRLLEAMYHLEKAMAVDFSSLAPRIHLVKLYDHTGDSSKRIELLTRLLGMRPNSAEASFLMANRGRKLNAALRDYSGKFVWGDHSPRSEKIRAILATLEENYHGAIQLYQRCLQSITDRGERKIIEKEVHRLEGILNGREPLEIPA